MKNDPFLPNIHSPADLKTLSDREIPALAAEIRQEIIAALAENGGEATVEALKPLLRQFDGMVDTKSSPKRKKFFDVLKDLFD